MRLLRPLLATLALSLTLPLPAEIEKKIHVDTEPHVIHSGDPQDLSDHIEEPYKCDTKDSLFWFRLEAGATLNIDAGLELATVRIETAAPPNNAASLVFAERSYFGHEINYQTAPIELLRAKDKQDGTLIISSPAWTESDESGTQSKQRWDPQSLKVDCNLIFAAPLPIDKTEETFTLPAGCTFRLEAYASDERQLPNIVFADETSTLVFAESTTDTGLATKYCNLLASSSGHFVFERDTTLDSTLTFTDAPKIEIVGKRLYFRNSPPQFGENKPTLLLKDGGTLRAPQAHLPTVTVEGEGTLQNIYELDCLTGNGNVTIQTSTLSDMDIHSIRVDSEEVLKINGNSNCQVQRIEGSGTVSFMGYIGGYNWKDLDAILRESKFTGTFESASSTIRNNIDFTEINENTFGYTLMPHIPSRLSVEFQLKIKMRLEQYVNLAIKWPSIGHLKYITLELIESGSFKGNATVPAFPKELRSFTLLSSDDSEINSEINCEVVYGKKTNTLTWKPTSSAMEGFTGLPDVVNKTLIDELSEEAPGKTPGTVIGKTSTEATKALECFSGIYEFVDSSEDTSAMDLHVDYDFGISRLTFVDGGENILVEVSLTSEVSSSPSFLGDLTLSANGETLKEVPELPKEEATTQYGLTAPEGKTVRWFLIPYASLPETGDLTITVSANPPQAN